MRKGYCNPIGEGVTMYSEDYLWERKSKFMKKLLVFKYLIFGGEDPEEFKFVNQDWK